MVIPAQLSALTFLSLVAGSSQKLRTKSLCSENTLLQAKLMVEVRLSRRSQETVWTIWPKASKVQIKMLSQSSRWRRWGITLKITGSDILYTSLSNLISDHAIKKWETTHHLKHENRFLNPLLGCHCHTYVLEKRMEHSMKESILSRIIWGSERVGR